MCNMYFCETPMSVEDYTTKIKRKIHDILDEQFGSRSVIEVNDIIIEYCGLQRYYCNLSKMTFWEMDTFHGLNQKQIQSLWTNSGCNDNSGNKKDCEMEEFDDFVVFCILGRFGMSLFSRPQRYKIGYYYKEMFIKLVKRLHEKYSFCMFSTQFWIVDGNTALRFDHKVDKSLFNHCTTTTQGNCKENLVNVMIGNNCCATSICNCRGFCRS